MSMSASQPGSILGQCRKDQSARGLAPRTGPSPVPSRSPSIGLPLGFVVTGIVSLLIGTGFLVLRPDLLATYHYNQAIIAATHLFTLGWISSVIMGAMYQLVPVALETTLYSERLGRWHFVLHLVGVAGMVSMFWVWDMRQLGHFGSVFGVGVVLFVYNLGRTLARIPRWNVVAAAIASALFWLLLTMLFGLFLAATKCWPMNWFEPLAQMHTHAHLGVVGFFLTMMVGVSYKLAPMFTLSEIQSTRRAWASLLLLNIGLVGAAPSILLQSGGKILFALIIVAGLVVYGIEMRAIVRARKRPALDWAMKYFLTALGLLLPVGALGLVLAWPRLPLTPFTGQLENVYGLVALLGVVSFAILGMLYKIVPFLVWFSSYSKVIGRGKVPALADLYSPRLQGWGYGLFLMGLVATSLATGLANEPGVRGGCVLLAASLSLFLVNMGRIISHLWKPKIEPLILKRPVPTAATA
jgi:Cytochrome C and Quinol oxidase polypeptide I